MLSAQSEFQRRDKEIEEYVLHLERLEQEIGFSVTLMNTMKSSALLMMYNIVESTMTNLVQDVFDHLHATNVSFESLNDTMKTLVLAYSKKSSPVNLVAKMNASALNLVAACFERTEVFSGNLDCKKIRETLADVGVTTQHSYKENALLKVKSERNDLAHGVKSFSDCGKSYSARHLRHLHIKTSSVLGRVISDFETFIDNKAYA